MTNFLANESDLWSLSIFRTIYKKKGMGLDRWWKSRNTCPKYILNCTCDDESSANSLLDLWSFAHFFWGIVYSIPVLFLDSYIVSFLITFGLACVYELFENTVAGRKLAAWLCCSKFYEGDHFWNSVADVICCLWGWLLMVYVRMIA